MGKASRWMMNFLLGRKKENGKKKHTPITFSEENSADLPTSTSSSFKRRWSFGKSASKERAHKSSKSLDSMTATPIVKHVLDLESLQNSSMAVLPAAAIAIKTSAAARPTSRAAQDAAATKIQSAFRSYLARKALNALRSLVKLQALVRGHLVRKHMTATIRRMHAAMAIQVRARFQRIQMAEESQMIVKSQSSRYGSFSLDKGFRRAHHKEAFDVNLYERRGILKSKRGYANHSQMERVEHGFTSYYSGDRSVSSREHQFQEFSFSTTHNSPRYSPLISNAVPVPARASFGSQGQDFSYIPNYMANTESSRAKVRSQSEPKQRPNLNIKAKSKRTASMDGSDGNACHQQHSSPGSKRIVNENQDPWFVKLYRSRRTLKETVFDANSTSSRSDYHKSLIAYEPHATLF